MYTLLTKSKRLDCSRNMFMEINYFLLFMFKYLVFISTKIQIAIDLSTSWKKGTAARDFFSLISGSPYNHYHSGVYSFSSWNPSIKSALYEYCL